MTKVNEYINTVVTLQAADLLDVTVSPFGPGKSEKLPYSNLLTNLENDLPFLWEFSFGTLQPVASPTIFGISLQNAAKDKLFIITNTDAAAVFNIELSYRFTFGGIDGLVINELDLVYGPQADGKAFILNDAADVESIAFSVGTDSLIDMSQGGSIVNRFATGVDSYLYDGEPGNFGLGVQPTEKFHLHDGNTLYTVPDATIGTPEITGSTETKHAKFWELAMSNTIEKSDLFTPKFSALANAYRLLYNVQVGVTAGTGINIDTAQRIHLIGEQITYDATSFGSNVHGYLNSLTGSSNTNILGNSCNITGDGVTALGINITEARSNLFVWQYSIDAARRRNNIEFGRSDAFKLSPDKAIVSVQDSSNKGIQLISSWWDGAASQDTTGYINHFLVDQPTGKAVLSLGNQGVQNALVIDINGAVRIGEDAHSASLITPSNEGLLVYKNFNAAGANSTARFLNPEVEDSYITVENSNAGELDMLVLSGATSIKCRFGIDSSGNFFFSDKNAFVTTIVPTT